MENKLLKFFFVSVVDADSEVMALKYSVSRLLVSILSKGGNHSSYNKLNESSLEMKRVYQFTVDFTKRLLLKLIVRNGLASKEQLVYVDKEVLAEKRSR